MESSGFESHPAKVSHRPEASLACGCGDASGAYADYYEAIDKHGVKFEREPMSLAEDGRGHVHVRQDIPANL
jgi:hypothetical protein